MKVCSNLMLDASVFEGADSFSVGMVLPDHQGNFVAGKNLRLPGPVSVFVAETVGVKEALAWLMTRQCAQVHIKKGSLMAVQAIQGKVTTGSGAGNSVVSCYLTIYARGIVEFCSKASE